MDFVIVGSAVVLVGTFLILGLLAHRSRMIFRIAVRNFLKRKRSTLFAVLGLAVGAAIVTGSLVVGDSLENAIVQSTYQNLGGVDEAVRSVGVFNESIVDQIEVELMDSEIDAVAPLMILAFISNLGTVVLNQSSGTGLISLIGLHAPWGHLALAGQVILYALAGLGALLDRWQLRFKPVYFIYFFLTYRSDNQSTQESR